MNKSDTIGALAAALAKAQGQMTFAAKDATNPHFRSKYADLAAVVEAVREPLSNNGLSFSQLCDFTESGGLVVETVLMHESGEWISGRLNMPVPKMDPQGVGSALTYSKRYSLASIVGIAADEDDDGEGAMGRNQQTTQEPKQQKQQQRQSKQQQAPPQQQQQSQQTTKEPATQDQLAKIADLIQALKERDGGTEAEILKTISHFVQNEKEYFLTPETLAKNCSKGWAGKIIGKAEGMLK